MVLRTWDDYPDLMTDIFDVIADGTRRDILQLLLRRAADGDAGTSVSQIVSELGISQPTVSKHLKVLREAELVSVREDGQRRLYSIEVEPLEVVDDWLVPFLVDAFGDEAPDIDLSFAPLPEGAAHAAEVFGRAAASAKHVVSTAFKRLGS
jgi:DNA-binding transcriptional ArsR family regulator